MIKKYKLVSFLIYFGQRLFFIRGIVKRSLTTTIHNLINYDSSKDPIESRVGTVVDRVPFIFILMVCPKQNNCLVLIIKKKLIF